MAREVSFEASGKVWTLRFGVNAIADLEERFDKPISAIFAEIDGRAPRIGTFRTLVQAGLTERLTDTAVGDLMDEVGLARMGDLLGSAVKAAFPDASAGEAPAEA